MSLSKALLIIVLFVVAGCKSLSQQQPANCSVSVNFTVAPDVDPRGVIDFQTLTQSVNKKYYQPLAVQQVNLTLIKAYVRPNHMILSATAVLLEEQNQSYYRGSDADANIMNTDGEYQSVLVTAIAEAVDTAVSERKKLCVNRALVKS